MGLHDRIRSSHTGNGAAATEHDHSSYATRQRDAGAARSGPVDPCAELKTRNHHACIAKLGPELFKKETTEDLSERVLRAVTEQLALDRTPLTREERRQVVREITDDILATGRSSPSSA